MSEKELNQKINQIWVELKDCERRYADKIKELNQLQRLEKERRRKVG